VGFGCVVRPGVGGTRIDGLNWKTMIELLSKPSCVQCTATKNWLKKREVPFVEHDVTVDEAAYQRAVSTGITSMPIVLGVDQPWGGFNPGKLESLLL